VATGRGPAGLGVLFSPSTRSAITYERGGSVKLLHADATITAEPVLPGFACRLGDLL
jgi:hypothetical protein